MKLRCALALLLLPIAALAQTTPPAGDGSWHFVVAGDSRNCGDVIMPAIAEAAKNNNAKFYWHLGDWRAIYAFDEDMVQANVLAGTPLNILSYLNGAFKDAIDNQLKPFDDRGVPVFVGIGNHETIWPMTRDRFLSAWPRLWTWRAPIRKVRLSALGCPVYFFSKTEVNKYMQASGFKVVSIETIGKLHCVDAVPV